MGAIAEPAKLPAFVGVLSPNIGDSTQRISAAALWPIVANSLYTAPRE